MKKKIKVKVIFFTYQRAILLDSALDSVIKKFKNISFPISIIYHFDKSHKNSYDFLKKKYKDKIKLYKRKQKSIFSELSLFLNPLNILFVLRWPRIFFKYNNFKFILENIINNSKEKYIMICPDDIFFYKKFKIPQKIFEIIDRNPNQYFLRPSFGKNIVSFNLKNRFKIFKSDKLKFVEWDNNNRECSIDMKYNFHVDGAIYNKYALLKFLKKIIYHNPVTLEANTLKYSRFKGYLKKTISPIIRVCTTYQINSVQRDTSLRFNERLQLNPKKLEKLYLKGYKILHKLTHKEKNQNNVIPKSILLKKGNKIENLKKILNKNS